VRPIRGIEKEDKNDDEGGRFRNLVAMLLEGHPAHTDALSLAYFEDIFLKGHGLSFRGDEDDRERLCYS
jgi:hypothetical protein